MILSIEKCSFNYPSTSKPVLKNISLHIDQVGIYGLAGKTGSGKTTLLKAVSGMLDLDSGSIHVNAEKVKGPSERLVAKTDLVKLVAQDPDLHYEISVEENIQRKLLMYEKDFRTKKSNFLLKKVGLLNKKNAKPNELSGGQQQLIGILCAIAEEPKLLLLDEPFSNLDFATKEYILDHLKDLIYELSITVLFVSHDAIDLLGVCDKIYVLNEGKIIEEGNSTTLFYSPKFEYTASLFGHYSKVISRGKTQFIRPSQLMVSKEGKIKVTVSKILFRGNYFEYKTNTKKEEIFYFYSTHNKWKVGQSLQLKVIVGTGSI